MPARQEQAYFADTYLTESPATVIATGAFDDDGGERWVAVSPAALEVGSAVVCSVDAERRQLANVRILEVKVKRGAIKVRYEAEHA